MAAHVMEAAEVGHSTTMARPLYVQTGERRLFGWLDARGGGPLRGIGLVICSPFGYEAVCAHRSMRLFAESAAALGVAVLRFDYSGTGDSDDIEPGADQIAIWVEDIAAATAELRRLTGVSRVGLLGLRLGALLATLALERGTTAQGLMSFAPVVSGPRYLKELRRSQLMGMREATPAAAEESVEFSGFRLSPSTVVALSQLDLAMRAPPPVSEVHILDRNPLPAAAAWNSMLSASGIRTRYEVSSGFVEMMLTPPYDAETPPAVTRQVCEFVQTLAGSAPLRANVPSPVGLPAPITSPSKTVICKPPGVSGTTGSLSEQALYLSREPALFGIVTTPDPSEKRRRAVILLNDGATYHIGASRLNVLLARRWAERGYYVLRFDLAGLGDSSTRPGAEDDEVFPPAVLDDVRTAIDFLRREYGCREVTLAGLCSGAYHCLRAAAAGLPVERVLMINAANFFREKGMARDSPIAVEVVRNPGLYLGRILSPKYWGRVLSGQVDLWRIARIYVGRIGLTVEGTLRNAARLLRVRLPRDLGWELEDIVARGVRLVFVFSRGETGIELLRILAGSSLKRLGDRCRVRLIDEADHVFSRSASRAVLEDILSEELFLRHDRVPARNGKAPAPDRRQP